MELDQVTIPDDLLQNLILPHTSVKTLLNAGLVCRRWNSWTKSEQFWKRAFHSIFYFVQSTPNTDTFKLSWRKLCIQADRARLPKPGTCASEGDNLRAGVVLGAKYNVQLKMHCTRRDETMEVNVDNVYPMIVPGTNGNPPIQAGLRVFAMWKKQNFWIGRIHSVNWEERTVHHIWEDNDKDPALSFDEVFVYPTQQQINELRQRLRNGDMNSVERVFASRSNLGERCGPYYEGVMNSADSNWLVEFEDNNQVHWVEPSRLKVREKMDASTVVPKLLSWMDSSLKGKKVLYQAQSAWGSKYLPGQISDEDDYCSIWLADENPNQGLLSFNVLYVVIGRDKTKRHLPSSQFMRALDRPFTRNMLVYFPLDEYYEEGLIESIVPGPDGHPDRVQVSKQRWGEEMPTIYHFSSDEVFVCERHD